MMAKQQLARIREERSRRFWRETAPYLRLAGSSLPGLFFLCLLGLFLYSRVLDGLPRDFPVIPVGAFILTYAVCSVWIRTFLQQADLVYLLPMEAEMRHYFRRSLLTGMGLQTAKTVVFGALVWPLYEISPKADGTSIFVLLLIMTTLKLLNVCFWWEEQRIRVRQVRILFSGLRWIFVYALVFVGMAASTAFTFLWIGMASLILIGLYRFPSRALVPWERFIDLEKRRQAQWRTLLNQFVDTIHESPDVRRNPISGLARLIPLRKRYAYRYLYFLTWARSPLFGITCWLVIVGLLLSMMTDEPWLRFGMLAGLLYALRLQLKELYRYHLYDDWSFAFPLEEGEKARAVRVTYRQVWVISAVILCIPLVLAII